ncbi:hypothetical protein J7W19_20970 [Streptomyces mobaraensis NBRC 13819 = DSM 40847]|uniref:CU044_5270 family protein n=1 Tax=Streptomyces mobaraensis (strain ATCC 29032 / DSM 40847 / JCM 4168 / NBRC 13819 / NCIMB 11159 / IPCR 16-22) TaxID=1223523 RepID=M3AT44_STRM1|nr:hypothetical protein [Streptomyces mobaraensis]EME96767.1 hypothetical protein H340_29816 [Streptomyces mobaraensis NBRC 13819 = DSM 40847]QTT75521.1 hypothetical protein J7W19_20970 [Streptomyces mobaraensis NBRC 13819 = DSM 40847]
MSGNGRKDGTEQDYLDFTGAARLRAAGRVEPPPADVVAAALDAVRAAARAEEGHTPEGTPAAPAARVPEASGAVPLRARWRRRAPALVSAAAVVAVAVGAAVWAGPGFGGGDGGRVRVAKTATTPSEGPGPFFEVRTDEMSRGLRGTEERSTKTVWLGRTEVRSRSGDGPVYQEPRSADGASLAFEVNSREVRWDDLDKLPTDREALRAKLTAKVPGMGDPSPEGLFNGIEELLARSPASPRLRAALYDLLPDILGVRTVGAVRDAGGRTGMAFDLTGDDRRSRLVIDPRTHRVLETVTFLVGDADPRHPIFGGLKDGAVVNRTTYLVTRPVPEAPSAKPRPRMTSFPLPGSTAD